MGILDKSGKRPDNPEESVKHNSLTAIEIPKRMEDLRQEMNIKLVSGVKKVSSKEKKKMKLGGSKSEMKATESKLGKSVSDVGGVAAVKELSGVTVDRSKTPTKKVNKPVLPTDKANEKHKSQSKHAPKSKSKSHADVAKAPSDNLVSSGKVASVPTAKAAPQDPEDTLVVKTDIEDPTTIPGLRVCVHWSFAKVWYDGTAVSCNPKKSSVRVLYDDGTHEELSVKRKRLHWADGVHPPSRPGPVKQKGKRSRQKSFLDLHSPRKAEGSKEKMESNIAKANIQDGSAGTSGRQHGKAFEEVVNELGQDVVGYRVEVKWPDDGKWYYAVVSKLNERRREFEVMYEQDGTMEVIPIARNGVKLADVSIPEDSRKRKREPMKSPEEQEAVTPKSVKKTPMPLHAFVSMVEDMGM